MNFHKLVHYIFDIPKLAMETFKTLSSKEQLALLPFAEKKYSITGYDKPFRDYPEIGHAFFSDIVNLGKSYGNYDFNILVGYKGDQYLIAILASTDEKDNIVKNMLWLDKECLVDFENGEPAAYACISYYNSFTDYCNALDKYVGYL